MCDIWCFWPLSASTTSEVKNDHAHVITQDICNKFIEIKFSVGRMVSQPNRLLQRSTTMNLINEMRYTLVWLIWVLIPTHFEKYHEAKIYVMHLFAIFGIYLNLKFYTDFIFDTIKMAKVNAAFWWFHSTCMLFKML